MALVVDEQLSTLAEAIVPAAPGGASAAQVAARNAAVAQVKTLCQKIMEYIVAQIEIKGVETSLDSDSVTGNGAGTDSLGGVHAPGPTNLSVTATVGNVSAKQSNDGKGLVE